MIFSIANGLILDISSGLGAFFLVTNFSILALVIMVILASYDVAMEHAEQALQLEFERAETLLLNVLAAQISVRLKAHEKPLADTHDSVSVLFADLASGRFDCLAERYNPEKIKTSGDAYMVATGQQNQASHDEKMTDLAIAMQRAFQAFRQEHRLDLKLRIGIHSGRVVAGVIGKQKFVRDL